MIKSSIGSYEIYALAMNTGLFDKAGKSKFMSVFDHCAEDLIYQMTLKIIVP